MLISLLATLILFRVVVASGKRGVNCNATINSLSDVAAAKLCTTININSFTVPAGKVFDLTNLLANTVINLQGDLTFAYYEQHSHELFRLSGKNLTFNGNSHKFDGLGAQYWDGGGGSSGKKKPVMVYIDMTGSFQNLNVLNSPAAVFSVNGPGPLIVSDITIDDSAGDYGGLAKNTDYITCMNQDDCVAFKRGVLNTFQNSYCSGGHGISIGSVVSGTTITDITVSGNTVVNSAQGLRIKTVTGATGSIVSRVTYSGNTITGARNYGVVICQNYNNGGLSGSPTNGVTISDIKFTGTPTTVSVGSGAKEVYVLCGSGSCTGRWDWSDLTVSGGVAGSVSGSPPIQNFSLY